MDTIKVRFSCEEEVNGYSEWWLTIRSAMMPRIGDYVCMPVLRNGKPDSLVFLVQGVWWEFYDGREVDAEVGLGVDGNCDGASSEFEPLDECD